MSDARITEDWDSMSRGRLYGLIREARAAAPAVSDAPACDLCVADLRPEGGERTAPDIKCSRCGSETRPATMGGGWRTCTVEDCSAITHTPAPPDHEATLRRLLACLMGEPDSPVPDGACEALRWALSRPGDCDKANRAECADDLARQTDRAHRLGAELSEARGARIDAVELAEKALRQRDEARRMQNVERARAVWFEEELREARAELEDLRSYKLASIGREGALRAEVERLTKRPCPACDDAEGADCGGCAVPQPLAVPEPVSTHPWGD